MPYPIGEKLVIAVASSALFDLTESDRVFREEGPERYRQFQRDHERDPLGRGVAFPLVRRLLSLNGTAEEEKPVEVLLLSRNDPDTGLRVFNSIEAYNLDISRAAFLNGRSPYKYLDSFNTSLFLSANLRDVVEAVINGAPAGRVFPTDYVDDPHDEELRIAFDFDGVLADDSAEAVFQASDLQQYHERERDQGGQPLRGGPLHRFLRELAQVQEHERVRRERDPSCRSRLRIAIVTSRSAPAHRRVFTTLRSWGVHVDEVFFLGGVDKALVLSRLKPHIFFDDQVKHVQGAAAVVPSVHVPFGVANADLLASLTGHHGGPAQ